jgi:transposase-like protein
MKGSIGTACQLKYSRPYIGRGLYKLACVERLSDKAKNRFKAISLYSSGKYKIEQICEIFEINRNTFYRWRKRYKNNIVQTLEDRSRRPKRTRQKVIRNYEVEHRVCEIRRQYPYFGKEKIKRILERDYKINISISSVGRILTQYSSILPDTKIAKKRAKTKRENKIRIKQIKDKLQGKISELLQVDTMELNLRFRKIYFFSAVDPMSKILYARTYTKNNSLNGKDFLLRLNYIHNKKIKYIQIDNGSEFEDHFKKEAKRQDITLVHNYPKSPKMNPYIEKVNETIQNEYLDRFYEEESIEEINKILLSCLIEYNFYRPHRSLGLLTPIEFCSSYLYNNKDPSMLHMYRTQAIC